MSSSASPRVLADVTAAVDKEKRASVCECGTTFEESATLACGAAHASDDDDHKSTFRYHVVFAGSDVSGVSVAEQLNPPEANPTFTDDVKRVHHSQRGWCQDCDQSFDGDTALAHAAQHAGRYDHRTVFLERRVFDGPAEVATQDDEDDDRPTLY